MFNQDEIVQNRYSVSFTKRWKNHGDWEIFGHGNSPNPCQSQLVAVNQQKNSIKNVEDAIRALQADFRAAPPAEKPMIKAEIEELKKQLPPLAAELKRLQSLLNKCYTMQSIRADVVVRGGSVIGVLN